jgi:hypothetical protein
MLQRGHRMLQRDHRGASLGVLTSMNPARAAIRGSAGPQRVVGARDLQGSRGMVFALRRRDTGGLVHRYATERAALAFVRDVVRVAGRERAAGFALEEQDEQGQTRPVAEGMVLVRRALEDRA